MDNKTQRTIDRLTDRAGNHVIDGNNSLTAIAKTLRKTLNHIDQCVAVMSNSPSVDDMLLKSEELCRSAEELGGIVAAMGSAAREYSQAHGTYHAVQQILLSEGEK